MAELRTWAPTVTSVLASAEACDRVIRVRDGKIREVAPAPQPATVPVASVPQEVAPPAEPQLVPIG